MAITSVQTNITWSAASTLSVTSATEVVSDAFTLHDTCIGAYITLTADNAGTPASGDTAIFRVRWSTDGGTTYDTAEHAQYLATLDTVAANTPGEDPARRTYDIGNPPRMFKLGCICAQAATRNITISARIEEQRAA